MRRVFAVLSLALAGAACSRQAAQEAAAIRAFESFQHALFARDEAAVQKLLTRDSREIAAHMPWDRIASQQPLEPIGCRLVNGRFEIEVRDPNRDGRVSRYVVVRQSGELRVDLIESTRFNRREIALPGPATRLVPRELTAEEIEEIAAREASWIR